MAFPVDLKYIHETEASLQVQFPKQYVETMLVENGGEKTADNDGWFLFPFWDKSDRKRLSRTSNHIILENNEAKKWRFFPSDVIAIATNDSGDYLVLKPATNGSSTLGEAIYRWDHETGETNLIADSIKNID